MSSFRASCRKFPVSSFYKEVRDLKQKWFWVYVSTSCLLTAFLNYKYKWSFPLLRLCLPHHHLAIVRGSYGNMTQRVRIQSINFYLEGNSFLSDNTTRTRPPSTKRCTGAADNCYPFLKKSPCGSIMLINQEQRREYFEKSKKIQKRDLETT